MYQRAMLNREVVIVSHSSDRALRKRFIAAMLDRCNVSETLCQRDNSEKSVSSVIVDNGIYRSNLAIIDADYEPIAYPPKTLLIVDTQPNRYTGKDRWLASLTPRMNVVRWNPNVITATGDIVNDSGWTRMDNVLAGLNLEDMMVTPQTRFTPFDEFDGGAADIINTLRMVLKMDDDDNVDADAEKK